MSRQTRSRMDLHGPARVQHSTAPEAQTIAVEQAWPRSTRSHPGQLEPFQEDLPVIKTGKPSARQKRQPRAELATASPRTGGGTGIEESIMVTPARAQRFVRTSGDLAQDAPESRHANHESEENAGPQELLEDVEDDEDVLDVEVMSTGLEGLEQASEDVLDNVIPSQEEDISRHQKVVLANHAALRAHYQAYANFSDKKRCYTSGGYIKLSSVLAALFDSNATLLSSHGAWRPDAIIYKANLTQLLCAMLMKVPIRTDLTDLEDANIHFAANIAGSSPQDVDMAIELTTQLVIARIGSNDVNWGDDQTIAKDSFINPDTGRFTHWEDLRIHHERPSQQTKYTKLVDARVRDLIDASSKDLGTTLRRLDKEFPWAAFKDELVAWSERRRTELDKDIALAGGAAGIAQNVQDVLSPPQEDGAASSIHEDADDLFVRNDMAASDVAASEPATIRPQRDTATEEELRPSRAGMRKMKSMLSGHSTAPVHVAQAQMMAPALSAPASSAHFRDALSSRHGEPASSAKRGHGEVMINHEMADKRRRIAPSPPQADINPTQDEGPDDGFQTQRIDEAAALQRRQAQPVRQQGPFQPDNGSVNESQALDDPRSEGQDAPNIEEEELPQSNHPSMPHPAQNANDVDQIYRQAQEAPPPMSTAARLELSGRTPWTAEEERMLEYKITELGLEVKRTTMSFTPEAVDLPHRPYGQIRAKARSMKVNMIERSQGTSGLSRGWMLVKLNKEGKERLQRKGIIYDDE